MQTLSFVTAPARRRGRAGFTTVELLVATVVVGIVMVAIISVYLTSMDVWESSGTRLGLQRRADMAVERIMNDVRSGSRVEINAAQDQMTIYRATASGDSTVEVYSLSGQELRNSHGTVLATNVVVLRFTSANGIKVMIELDLLDNVGTPTLTGDDIRIQTESVAICRNQSLY